MLWIGLTGGIGSGKSTASDVFKRAGTPVVDADALARQTTAIDGLGFGPVVEAFGPGILDLKGGINRQLLGKKVFSDPTALKQLEGILHPLIQTQVAVLRKSLEQQGHKFAIYDVPLLFEKNLQKNFDKIIVVTCSPQNQVSRTVRRGGLTEDEVRARIKVQMPLTDKIKLADFVVENNGNISDLEAEVQKVISTLNTITKPKSTLKE